MSEVILDGADSLRINLRLTDRVSWSFLTQVKKKPVFILLQIFIWRTEYIIYFSSLGKLSFTYELCA